MLTPQWRGLLNDGTLGAFDPQNAPYTGMRLMFRVLDLGSEGWNANNDSGNVCISSVRVDGYPISALTEDAVVYDTPISNATHAPFIYGQNPLFAQIDDATHTATYRLNTDLDAARLIPAVDLDPPNHVYNLPSLYPVVWPADTLFRVSADLQMDPANAGIDPPDAVTLYVDTATNELGLWHWTTRGSWQNMDRSGSPRLPGLTNGPQTYVGFFYSHNATAIDLTANPDMNRLRPMVDFQNRPELNGTGTGADGVQILGLKLTRMLTP